MSSTLTRTNLEAQLHMGRLIGEGDYVRLAEVIAPECVDHDPMPDQGAGLAGMIATWGAFRASFPDVQFDCVECVATEEFVTAVLDITGTHLGEYLGHAPTGRSFRIRAVQLGRFIGGRMTERWGAMDTFALSVQVGLS